MSTQQRNGGGGDVVVVVDDDDDRIQGTVLREQTVKILELIGEDLARFSKMERDDQAATFLALGAAATVLGAVGFGDGPDVEFDDVVIHPAYADRLVRQRSDVTGLIVEILDDRAKALDPDVLEDIDADLEHQRKTVHVLDELLGHHERAGAELQQDVVV